MAAADGAGIGDGWSIASILRRLADEFDAGTSDVVSEVSADVPHATVARSIAAITPTTPVELDVSHGGGHPVRREPLVESTSPLDTASAS
jgi:hypothetical protein